MRVFWESYGEGEQTLLFLPTWTLVHSRVWKAQIPYFARHFRVICFDPRGNGRSDRPPEAAAYDEAEFAQDAIDVMDACGVDRAVCVALSHGRTARAPAGDRASRAGRRDGLHRRPVPGHRCAPCTGGFSRHPRMHALREQAAAHDARLGQAQRALLAHGGYADFVQWWAERMLPEPHSTKQIEDAVAWSHDTDGATLGLTTMVAAAAPATRRDQTELAKRSAARCS